jgi:hypothetical protein
MVIETGQYGKKFFKIYVTFITIILCAMCNNNNTVSGLKSGFISAFNGEN